MAQVQNSVDQTIPAGSVISKLGVRPYYTVGDSERAEPKPRAEAARRTAGNVETLERQRTEGELSEDGRQPLANQQSSKRHKDAQTDAVNDWLNSTPDRRVKAVDAQTSPIGFQSHYEAVRHRQPPPSGRSFGDRTIKTEDYYNALSVHQSEAEQYNRQRNSLIIDVPPSTRDGRSPTPFPTRTRDVINQTSPPLQSSPVEEHTTTSKSTQVVDKQPLRVHGYFLSEGDIYPNKEVILLPSQLKPTAKQIIIQQKQKPVQAPVYIVQEEDNSDDEHDHYYYGANNQPIPVPPGMSPFNYHHSMPYGFNNPMSSYNNSVNQNKASSSHHRQTSFQITVDLRYGAVVNQSRVDLLPPTVAEELLNEYGHIEKCRVTIVKQGNKYNIHNYVER